MLADGRRAEIAANLAGVRARIEAACAAAGRSPEEVNLVAVTKFRPAVDALHLYALGQRVFGENRDQEAAPKAAEVAAALADTASDPFPEWHFIGQLQTNKVKSVVSYADVIESVDRPELAAALAKAAERAGAGRAAWSRSIWTRPPSATPAAAAAPIRRTCCGSPTPWRAAACFGSKG